MGLANQIIGVHGATSGVDWQQALNVGKSLLFSPLIGFVCAGLLLLLLKMIVRIRCSMRSQKAILRLPFGFVVCLFFDLHGR